MNAHNPFGTNNSPRVPTAAVPAHPLSGAAVSICSECNGSGEVCFAVRHPDDPRADRFAECDYCGGTGEADETDYPKLTSFPGGAKLSIEEVHARIAEVFLGVAR